MSRVEWFVFINGKPSDKIVQTMVCRVIIQLCALSVSLLIKLVWISTHIIISLKLGSRALFIFLIWLLGHFLLLL